MKRLLKIRRKLQKKRNFNSKRGHWKKCKEAGWRAPRGIHSKLKKGKKGKGALPSSGYRSPIKLRGATPEGLMPVLVKNQKDLEAIKDHSIAVLSSKLGKRKREELRQKAQDLRIEVLN